MPFVLVVANRKGGTGKSTVALSLAVATVSATVSREKRFEKGSDPGPFLARNVSILVDGDSQGNLSTWCLERPAEEVVGRRTSVAALEFPARPETVERRDDPLLLATTREELVEVALTRCLFDVPSVPGLGLIPSTPRVHPEDAREICLGQLPGDVVVVDTGSDCSTPLVRSVLAQADAVVVPTVCEPWGTDGVRNVLEEIRTVGRRDLLADRRVRVVINRREKNKTQDLLEQALRDQLGEFVSDVVFPKSAPIALLSAGPAALTPKHKIRDLAAELWSDILSRVHPQGAAA